MALPTITNIGGQSGGLLGFNGTVGPATFSNAGSAVSDIFAGVSAEQSAALQAQGLDIQAQGTQISAESEEL
jgi:hypothetical protein